MVLLTAVGLGSLDLNWIEDFQCRVFDYYQRIKPRVYEDVPVRVIDLDDESLARLGQWPWPRTQVARLVTRLSDLGASAIAFDMVFAEPDRTSPGTVVKFWPPGPETESLKARAQALPDHEKVLAKAFRSANVVAGFTVVPTPNDRVPAGKANFSVGGASGLEELLGADSPLRFVPDYPGAVANLPVLEAAAAGNGAFSFMAERDGVVRRAPLMVRRENVLLPSLALEALRVAQGQKNILVKGAGSHGDKSAGKKAGLAAI
ncbi:MAG: CHASE2 domain-containing protein, partial [Elusimicrobiota bacterium]